MARRDRGGNVIIAVLFALASIGLLFWNEGRSVERIKTIDAGRDVVAEGNLVRIDAALQGRLVHLAGKATGGEIADDVFHTSASALRLDRKVEMYQWVEEKRTHDHNTTYSYTMGWRASRQTGFHFPNGHVNPAMPYRDKSFYPAAARLGAYRLSRGLVDELDADRTVTPRGVSVANIGELRLAGDLLYSGDPDHAELGDLRIGFTTVQDQTVSVLAGLADGELVEFRTAHGDLAMIEPGAMDAGAMLALAETRNAWLTWSLRIAGTVIIFLCLYFVLSSSISWIPFARGLARAAAALVAIVLAVPIAVSVIAFAWLWFRPLWAIGLFCLAALGPIFLVLRDQRARRAPAVASAMPPPPPPPPR